MSTPTDLVVALASSRRAVQLYPPSHPSYMEAIQSLTQAVLSCLGPDGTFVLNLHEGRLYSGSQVIPGDSPAVGALGDSMERHRLESLTFEQGFGDDDASALAEVLNMRPSPDLSVADELEARDVRSIVIGVLEAEEDEEREERDRQRERDRAQYRQLVTVLRKVHGDVTGGSSPSLSQANDMVGNIMSRLVEDDAAVLALATMTGTDDAALFHSINVMIYALALGVQLGLPDEGLLSLGMSALLHDVGKSVFDLSDAAEREQAKMLHPTVGAEILARIPDPDRTPMLVAYEHHMGADGTGYPPRAADYVGHPYSRMIAIADRYENLTKAADGRDAMTPDRAVMQILTEGGHALDPFFVRLYARALGVFPVGCVVRLSDLSVGVVRAKTADPLLPVLLLVFDDSGAELPERPEIDLTQDGRSIVEVVDPEALDLAVAEHI